RVRAEREVARRLADREAHHRLEPLPVVVDEADRRDGRLARRGGGRRQVVERRLGIGVQDAVALERREALALSRRERRDRPVGLGAGAAAGLSIASTGKYRQQGL